MPDNNDIDNELQRAITSILKAVNAGKTVSDAQLRDFLSNVGKTSNGLKDVEYSAKKFHIVQKDRQADVHKLITSNYWRELEAA